MSARTLILALLVIALTGCERQPASVGRPQYLSAAEREPYVKDFQPSCLLKLGTGALSRRLSQKQRAQYCSCAAFRSAETITLEEIATWTRTSDREALEPHMAAVDKYCLEKLIPAWLLEMLASAGAPRL
jgi:hypothetical protein